MPDNLDELKPILIAAAALGVLAIVSTAFLLGVMAAGAVA